ncbi:hypothetical protein C8R45DRAFT_1023161 [Mycena sanguinolenta]|nr:hypothetical protein C8R45DRAFT_1023161 [Mycena sanguinolenta]
MRPFRGFGLHSPALLATSALCLRCSFIYASVLPSRSATSASSPNSPPSTSPTPRRIRAPNYELRKRTLSYGNAHSNTASASALASVCSEPSCRSLPDRAVRFRSYLPSYIVFLSVHSLGRDDALRPAIPP